MHDFFLLRGRCCISCIYFARHGLIVLNSCVSPSCPGCYRSCTACSELPRARSIQLLLDYCMMSRQALMRLQDFERPVQMERTTCAVKYRKWCVRVQEVPPRPATVNSTARGYSPFSLRPSLPLSGDPRQLSSFAFLPLSTPARGDSSDHHLGRVLQTRTDLVAQGFSFFFVTMVPLYQPYWNL